jgi:hypothetical protein
MSFFSHSDHYIHNKSDKWWPPLPNIRACNSKIIMGIVWTAFFLNTKHKFYQYTRPAISFDTLLAHIPVLHQALWLNLSPVMNDGQIWTCHSKKFWALYQRPFSEYKTLCMIKKTSFTNWHIARTCTCHSSVIFDFIHHQWQMMASATNMNMPYQNIGWHCINGLFHCLWSI